MTQNAHIAPYHHLTPARSPSRTLLLLLGLIISLYVNGCKDSANNTDPAAESELFKKSVHAVVKKANIILTQPHSRLITTGYPENAASRAYVSLATYWWPNPDTENGLPYIKKDGQVNPETMSEKSNLPQLIRMARRVEVLSSAYYFTGNPIYANRAVEQIKVWFINPETSMHPHLEHAQIIRGINSGRSYGVIDGWWLVRVVESVSLLRQSPAWSTEINHKMKSWFTHYLNWLRNSQFGETEKLQMNNHGTWYDVQIIVFSRFINRNQFVYEYLDKTLQRRISEQILFSGKQKFEANRTRPEHYSIYNLYGLLKLARIAKENSLHITEPGILFSGSLIDAYRYLIRQVGYKNPASFIQSFDETDTSRIWYMLLMEADLLFDKQETRIHFQHLITRFPELHSKIVLANSNGLY